MRLKIINILYINILMFDYWGITYINIDNKNLLRASQTINGLPFNIVYHRKLFSIHLFIQYKCNHCSLQNQD
jgi:hypothetical protein